MDETNKSKSDSMSSEQSDPDKILLLRRLLIEGENSGDAGKLDFNEIKQLARQRAGISSPEE